MPHTADFIRKLLIKLIWYNTNSENTCCITGFYEMWCRTAQTKSLCYKWEIYNQKWYKAAIAQITSFKYFTKVANGI